MTVLETNALKWSVMAAPVAASRQSDQMDQCGPQHGFTEVNTHSPSHISRIMFTCIFFDVVEMTITPPKKRQRKDE